MKSKMEIEAIILKLKMGHCPKCLEDDNIFCPRDVDVQCLECARGFCLGHIVEHGKEVHLMVDDFQHCSVTAS